MNITRNNYEEFFMLYADNELPAAQRNEVEAFVAANPDLAQELLLFQQFKLSPDEAVIFNDKASLLKQAPAELDITPANTEEWFVLYADNQLSNPEKSAVEEWVYHNPSLQQSFELMQQAKLRPDGSIVFANKEILYRKEEDDKVVPFRWWRMAAAAAVLLFIMGAVWLNREKKTGQPELANIQQGRLPVKQPARQPVKETKEKQSVSKPVETATIAAVKNGAVKEKEEQTPAAFVIAPKKEIIQKSSNLPEASNVLPEQDFADNSTRQVTSSLVTPVNEPSKSVEIKKPLIAAATAPLIDQPAIILHPDEDNKTTTTWASVNNDNVEVLNTSVSTKSPLRGLFRKATRMIAQKASAGNEDGNRKSILIGGFEIAVR